VQGIVPAGEFWLQSGYAGVIDGGVPRLDRAPSVR
jgi:hypothetical protein